jgi:hypothetical protein
MATALLACASPPSPPLGGLRITVGGADCAPAQLQQALSDRLASQPEAGIPE